MVEGLPAHVLWPEELLQHSDGEWRTNLILLLIDKLKKNICLKLRILVSLLIKFTTMEKIIELSHELLESACI